MKKYLFLFLAAVCFGCSRNSGIDKHWNERDNVVNVHDQIREIPMEEVLISSISRLYLVDNYLIIMDANPYDKYIHLFDKNDFHPVMSAISRGQGPGEIVMMGYIGAVEGSRTFYITDHGKLKIFGYELDSLLSNPRYMPFEKNFINTVQFPDKYQFVNDSICIGRMIAPTGNSGFNQSLGKWNMNTGEIVPIPNFHPEIHKRRTMFAVSTEDGIIVECYLKVDLMTISDLDGQLKYNVRGPNRLSDSRRLLAYGKVAICGNRIIASYSGEDNLPPMEHYATKFIVFDLEGNYEQALDTKRLISDFCYDRENNRLIIIFNDEMQFGYLSLDGIVR
ncbi:MAG: 6-bladed beta-propeller [Tannerella sp.]|jgi:hypothetical protein|nr:6-bladed beta-propeller [Tannerella sp.]